MKLIVELRQLYKEGKIEELKRKYTLGKWMLSEEERNNIEKALAKEESLFDYALRKMGGKIVK
ncbi:MAG: hypothetical protein WCR65_02470 [Parcubacteria group bacterium]|jgi:hypothetical protein